MSSSKGRSQKYQLHWEVKLKFSNSPWRWGRGGHKESKTCIPEINSYNTKNTVAVTSLLLLSAKLLQITSSAPTTKVLLCWDPFLLYYRKAEHEHRELLAFCSKWQHMGVVRIFSQVALAGEKTPPPMYNKLIAAQAEWKDHEQAVREKPIPGGSGKKTNQEILL